MAYSNSSTYWRSHPLPLKSANDTLRVSALDGDVHTSRVVDMTCAAVCSSPKAQKRGDINENRPPTTVICHMNAL